MLQLNDALKEFEATEANLDKLDKLWKQMAELLPSATSGVSGPSDEDVYKDIERKFENIRKIMPKIDGFELANKIQPCDSILPTMLEYVDLGEPLADLAYHQTLREQGDNSAATAARLSRRLLMSLQICSAGPRMSCRRLTLRRNRYSLRISPCSRRV